MKKTTQVFVFMVFVISSPCWADYHDALKNNDYVTALKEIKPLAESGDTEAQLLLGGMNYLGQCGPVNYDEAFRWFYKAADNGNSHALYLIGGMYAEGKGVPQDYTEAIEWYRKAADRGLADAQVALGNLYINAQGVDENDMEAAILYRKAADQNNAAAQANLGCMYLNGQGVKKDYAQAIKLLRKSAEQGNAVAQYNLGNMYDDGLGVARNHVEAVKLYAEAAKQGDVDARDELAEIRFQEHLKKIIGDKNFKKSKGKVYNFFTLLYANPYDVGGKYYLLTMFPVYDAQLLSRTTVLLFIQDKVIYADFGSKSATTTAQARTFVVRGDSRPYRYITASGSALIATRVHVIGELQ